jgi:hypothetical protein
MKNSSVLLAACLMAFPVIADRENTHGINPGDTYEQVIAVLGQPESFLKMDPAILLKYDRGTVKLSNNKVVAIDLVSPEAAKARRDQERMQHEQRRLILAEQKARRIAEGTTLKQSRMSDPAFLTWPADRQVAFWQQFQVRYPEVSCTAEYLAATSRYEQEMEQLYAMQQQDRRIRDLEDQLDRAERRNNDTWIRYVNHRTIFIPSTRCLTTPVIPVNCKPATVVVAAPVTRLTKAPYATLGCNTGINLAGRLSY